jgi:hypothetical protein
MLACPKISDTTCRGMPWASIGEFVKPTAHQVDHERRCHMRAYRFEDFVHPGDTVADPDPARLGTGPQLEVLRPVVVANSGTYRMTR